MTKEKPSPDTPNAPKKEKDKPAKALPKEVGGYEDHGLLEPTRYGDWDVKGRCSDF